MRIDKIIMTLLEVMAVELNQTKHEQRVNKC